MPSERAERMLEESRIGSCSPELDVGHVGMAQLAQVGEVAGRGGVAVGGPAHAPRAARVRDVDAAARSRHAREPHVRTAASSCASTTVWRVHDLDRIDKHRRLTVMAASLGHQAIGVPEGVEPDVKFHVASGPVHDGQVLASYVGAEVGVEYLFDRSVVLAEGDIADEPAVDAMLDGFLHYVAWVVWRLNNASRSWPAASAN